MSDHSLRQTRHKGVEIAAICLVLVVPRELRDTFTYQDYYQMVVNHQSK